MRAKLFLLLLSGVCLLAQPSHAAQVLVSGNSMDSSNAGFIANLNSLGHTYTFVPPANFIGTSLSGFNVVWLDGFSQYNGGLNTKLTSFLNGGGTLLVQSPGFGSESISDYPLGSTLNAIYTYTELTGENLVRIFAANAGHPINAGLTQAGLSGWNPSASGIFTASGSFTALADNGDPSKLITLVQTVGTGTLVYTEQGIAERLSSVNDPVALTLLNNIILTAVPEPGMIGLLLVGIGSLLGVRRRFE